MPVVSTAVPGGRMQSSPRRILWLLFMTLCIPLGAASATPAAITLGPSGVTLEGPWKFHTGDDARWADLGFDDSSWETMDLKAPADATDGDVGITGYTAGWGAKGHPGYHGYAWYRFHLTVTPPAGGTLAVLGPWAVDSAYQVYANGALLGGVGDFSGATPTVHGNHYPKFFELPPDVVHGGSVLLAIRVWAGSWVGADGGGIHVAPVLGERDAIIAQYRLQWLKIFEGYVVDAVPALLFVLLALMTLCLAPFDRGGRVYPWLATALFLSAIQRGNQAFFFWWQIETVQGFVFFIIALVGSMSLGAWMMAWRGWFGLDRPAWLPKLVAASTLTLAIAQLLGRPWLFHAAYPDPVAKVVHDLIMWTRLAFLLVFVLIAYQGIPRQGREGWYALPAVLAIGAVLFSSELSALHVPGIWFPYGVGLSLSEIMSVVFSVLLFVLLLRRLWSYARRPSA